MIFTMFQWMVPPCLNFIRKHCTQYCNPGEISLVRNMMLMLEMLLNDALQGSTKKEEEAKHLDLWIQITFIQAGGCLIFYMVYFVYLLDGELQESGDWPPF